MKELLKDLIDTIDENLEYLFIEKKLNSLLREVINYTSITFNLEQPNNVKKFSIVPLSLKHGVSYGVERDGNIIKISEQRIKTKRTRSINYLLYFIVTKESLLHFLKSEIGEIEEAFVNILTILWLIECFKFRTKDNRLYKTINSRIFSGEIGGLHFHYFTTFVDYLIIKKKKFKDFLEIYRKCTEEISMKGKELFTEIQSWLYSLFSELDIIAPFYIKKQLLPALDMLLELGYEKANVQTIADRLNVHPNTIRNNYKILLEKYRIYWQANINLDKMKLHKYFLRIITEEIDSIEKIVKIVWNELPYNNRVFLGEMDDSTKIIYCPTIYCPHLVTEKLNAQLKRLYNIGMIKDYKLREIRERIHYGAITTEPIEPTLEYFKKNLLIGEKRSKLHKYTFSHIKENLSVNIEEKEKYLDYNLLFYLSIIYGKPLLKDGRSIRILELPKLYKLNNISLTDTIAQADFLNQIEIRAKRRGFISYNLFMIQKVLIDSASTIFEIPTISKQDEEKVGAIMNQLQTFAILGNIVLSDRVIGLITGISHDHPISKIIKDVIEKNELESIIYSIRLNKSRTFQFHELYDFEENKWLLNSQSI